MARLLLIILTGTLLSSVALLSGCAKKPVFEPPVDGISRFPTGEPLEEGDVILARSYGLIGAMFANYSVEGGSYSHGAMVYRAEDGTLMMLNYRPTGMETCTPEEFFTRYNKLALLRYTGGLESACTPEYCVTGRDLRGIEAISATSRYWLQKNAEERIPPDYRLDHDDPSSMFCLELTSTVYRDCGLPDPFYKSRKVSEDPLLSIANELFKADVVEIRSPSSALENPEFELISDWIRPEFDLREEALNEELIRVVIADIERGMRPRTPNFLGRMKLRQIFFLYHLITKTMFWRPKQDLPDFIDTEVIHNAYMLYKYVALSKKRAKVCMQEVTEPVHVGDPNVEPTLETVRRIVRESCNAYRDKYLYMSSPSGTAAPCTPCASIASIPGS